MSGHHPDPNYECVNDPVCRDYWDGYYSPAHSVRCAETNEKRGIPYPEPKSSQPTPTSTPDTEQGA